MKTIIETIPETEDETIVIRCHEMTETLTALVRSIETATEGVTAYLDGEIYKIPLSDIFWFEVLENRAFVYCADKVYEAKLKLYEFEQLASGTHFFRATKSTVVNADKIVSISPTISGRFTVKLTNGERAVVSRGYVSALKKVMGIGGDK